MTPKEFVQSVWSSAVSVANRIGVSPDLVVTVAGLESNWGKSATSYNYFGIKGRGDAGSNVLLTTEYIGNRAVKLPQTFAAYSSPASAFEAFGNFLTKNKRYADVISANDLSGEIAALGKSGYATDPNYAAKLTAAAKTVADNKPAMSGLDSILNAGQYILRGMTPFGVGEIVAGKAPNAPQTDIIQTWLQRGILIVLALLFLAAAIFMLAGNKTIIAQAIKG